ncbi:MAG: L(+)-tartrate dehydratase subunit alpha [Deltaproteobacteria bacterium]|nr:L(+)-tartrate dehydratase subunit alpha [Deltaproteobacteria bacterium]
MDEKKRAYLLDIISKFIGLVSIKLPDDVWEGILGLSMEEKDERASLIFKAMTENQRIADTEKRPCCQDTGVVNFFVKAGSTFPYLGELRSILTEAVRKATLDVPLRHNTVSIFEGRNFGDNLGEGMPFIFWEIEKGSEIELSVYLAGGGCSLPGRSYTFMPSDGYEAIVRYIFDTSVEWGINACPPLTLGIGIAGSSDIASYLSKKALLRPIGKPSDNPYAQRFESILKDGLDRIGIGPQGLGGLKSVLAVQVEVAARHPSTISVGLSIGCWSLRKGTLLIDKDLNYEILSHRGTSL